MEQRKPTVSLEQIAGHVTAGHSVRVSPWDLVGARVWCEEQRCPWNRQELVIEVRR